METVVASTEITVLALSGVLLVLQVMAQAGTRMDLGNDYILGPRDNPRESDNVVSQRLSRANRNMLETYPAFIALVVALVASGQTGGIAAIGAWVYLVSRAVFVVLYAAGVPVLRTIVWLISVLGLAMMAIRFFFL